MDTPESIPYTIENAPLPLKPFNSSSYDHLDLGSRSNCLFTEGREIQGVESADFSNAIIFPGSFNPFHFGHHEVAKMVSQSTGKRVIFEITAQNADKKSEMTLHDMVMRRAWQFLGLWPVIFRNDAGLFTDKIRAYPGASFVIGEDTAVRILDPKYYPDGIQGVVAMLHQFWKEGRKFYVAPRSSPDIDTLDPYRLYIPELYRYNGSFVDLFMQKHHISSTMLRSE